MAAAQAPAGTRYGFDVIVDVLRALGIEYAALNPGATFRGLHQRLAPVDVPILADTAAALPALLARLEEEPRTGPPARRAHAEELRRRHAALRQEARSRCEAEWNVVLRPE